MNEQELVGVTLGSCTIERVIGKGGMAIVYLAQQARPTRTVAVKVLLPSGSENDPEQQKMFLERFRREADTIARLEHKNILPVYEYEEAVVHGHHLAYLVMPYIRGGTLRQRIDDMKYNDQKFELQTVASYISQIADALSYAHSLGVVHRDIKPGNLLFHSDGRLLLSDFGIVRLNAMPSLTLAGSFIGTAEYASPEQVAGGELDSRSDIYSLGVILYELLTGTVPFTGPTPFAIMARQLHEQPPSLRASRPDLSPSIEFVVKKALAKAPKDRYQQVSELADDFAVAVAPVVPRPVGLRLSGDSAGNSDLTVADSSWQPPARALGTTKPMQPIVDTPQPAYAPIPVSKPSLQPTQLPSPGWQSPAAQQIHLPQVAPDADALQTYRPNRRLYFLSVSVATLLLQFLVLALTLRSSQQYSSPGSAVALGILLGNALNLLSLAAIGFIGVTRQSDMRGLFNRVLWVSLAALVLSAFFISYGQFNPTNLPVISYIILLSSNIFSIRELSKADTSNEQVVQAPVLWQAALGGALTGLIPLVIILIFALLGPLPLVAGSNFFLRMACVLVIGFIGAPTPGAMLAVWLSRKMSFPTLARTSALAGLFMFVAAYLLVVGGSWLVTGQPLFIQDFAQQPALPLVIIGAILSLIGLLRGMLDAWIYHYIMLRRP